MLFVPLKLRLTFWVLLFVNFKVVCVNFAVWTNNIFRAETQWLQRLKTRSATSTSESSTSASPSRGFSTSTTGSSCCATSARTCRRNTSSEATAASCFERSTSTTRKHCLRALGSPRTDLRPSAATRSRSIWSKVGSLWLL